MLITVPIVSTSLDTILDTQYSNFSSMREWNEFNITIQNLWATDIYIEKTWVAAVASWIKILAAGWEFKFSTLYPNMFNLITATENADVRIFTT